MPINSSTHLLMTSIKDLPFTDHFRDVSETLHFNTIGEILEMEAAQILKLPGFTYHFLQELMQFLEQHKLAGLLRQ